MIKKLVIFSEANDKEVSKVDFNQTCLVVISLDFVLNKEGNYYRQVFLKECK